MGNTGLRTRCLCQGWRCINFFLSLNVSDDSSVLCKRFVNCSWFLTHRLANPHWAMCWTAWRLRCLTSPLHSLPGEQLTSRTLKWTVSLLFQRNPHIRCKNLRRVRCDCVSVFFFSSVGEREDWFHTLSRAIADHAAGLCTFGGPCSEVGRMTSVQCVSFTAAIYWDYNCTWSVQTFWL